MEATKAMFAALDNQANISKFVKEAEEKKNGKEIERVEWFDDRAYKRTLADGSSKNKWSVTTKLGIINKPFLSKWRGDLGNYEADRRSNYAKWRGSRIHDAIHTLLMEGHLDWDRKVLGQDEWLRVLYFEKFLNLFKPKILGSEIIVWRDSYPDVEEVEGGQMGYAGTMDLPVILTEGEYPITKKTVVVVPETGYYVGDMKTGTLSREHDYQTSSYANAEIGQRGSELFNLLEDFGATVGTFILHLDAENKEGFNVKLRTKPEMEHDFGLAVNAFKVWDDHNPNKTPTYFDMPVSITLNHQEA